MARNPMNSQGFGASAWPSAPVLGSLRKRCSGAGKHHGFTWFGELRMSLNLLRQLLFKSYLFCNGLGRFSWLSLGRPAGRFLSGALKNVSFYKVIRTGFHFTTNYMGFWVGCRNNSFWIIFNTFLIVSETID